MKKRILAMVLVAALLLGNLPVFPAAASQTAGTVDDPYSIATAAEFVEFLENADNTSGTTAYYRLTADIKADEQHSALGGYTAMDVVLDGGGHTVSGFDVSGAIFSKITASTIRAVNFSDMNVTAADGSAAVIAAVNEGMILNCTVEADCTITGTAQMAGGLAAENGRSGILTNSISRVSIPYAAGVVGVLVGKNTGIVQHCYGRIQNDIPLYGVSSGSAASVSDCLSWKNGVYAMTAKGGETPVDMDIRQLAAEMTEMTQNNNNTLTVEHVGNYGALWAVENGDLALSLDGRTAQVYLYADQSLMDAKFTFTDRQAYPIQTENGQKFSLRAGYYLDGVYYSNRFTVALALAQQYTMVNSFVYRPNQDYVKTLTNLIDGNNEVTYVDAFLSASYDRDAGISQGVSVVYPYCATLTLSNRKTEDEIVDYVFEGSGTPEAPYQISSAYELMCLASHVKNGLSHNGLRFNEAHYILTRDIDLSGVDFEPIGVYSRDHSLAFRGCFDGQGYQIKGLTLNSGRTYCGLFGITAGRATETGVKNAVIKNLNVSGLSVGSAEVYGDLVGGIVGMAAYTTIDGCVTQGSITAGTQVGGIVGYAYHCQLRNCGANVKITTMSCYAWSGGIAGYGAYSTVDTSYSACAFTNENVILEEYLHTGTVAGYRKEFSVHGCVFLPSDRINVGKVGSGVFEGSQVLLRSEDFLQWLQTTSEQRGYWAAWEAGADIGWNEGYPVIQHSKDRTYQVTCQWTTAGSVACLEPSSGQAVPQTRYTAGATVIITTTDLSMKGLELVDGSSNPLDIPVTREGAYTFSFTMPDQAVWVIPDFGVDALCGRGTAEDPYWIYSKECLDTMAELINTGAPHGEDCEPYKAAHYKMIRDVDFGGNALRPISTFEGDFDGNGHTISNARVQGTTLAMFCNVNNAQIKNLVLEGFAVEGHESAILAQSTAGNTVLANIMVLNTQGGGLVYQNDDTLTVANCMLENLTFSGAGAWVLNNGEGTVVLRNILLCGSDAAEITVVGNSENLSSLTREQVLCHKTASVTWETVAQLNTYASASLTQYKACLWTAEDRNDPIKASPRLSFDGTGVIGTITCDPAFGEFAATLFDVEDVPAVAASGQIVEIPCYLNVSTANLKILDADKNELSFTVDINGEAEGMGYIRFEMPAGAVTITNNGQPLKMLYLEGEGTKYAPFEIWTPADLVLMADVISQRQLQYVSGEDYVDYTDGYFKLMADLNMEGVAWEGIGTEQYTFFGTLDGNDKTISNLNVNNGQGETACPGLFLSVGQGGVVQDLTLDGAVVFPGGQMNASGVIAHKNMGIIRRCAVANSSVSLGNYAYLGGIAGYNDTTGVIMDCVVRETSLTRRHGGTSSRPMGGIVQQNDGLVYCCYVYGCSFTNGTDANGALIVVGNSPKNCYYGSNRGKVGDQYNAGASQGRFASGEIAYLLQNGRTDLVWGQNLDNGQPNPGYPVLGGARVCAVGDCTAITGYSNQDSGGGHEYSEDGFCVRCDAYQPADDSNEDGIYEIGNAGQLYWFAALVNTGLRSASAVLTGDIHIDQSGAPREWTPIAYGTRSFLGHFDGQGHCIDGLESITGDTVGLFGTIGPEGLVEQVGVDGFFYSTGSVGSIAALNQGIIRNCFSVAFCVGGEGVGGIAGINEGRILHCFSVHHPITGENRGTAENCYFVTDADAADGKTKAQFASGMVAYLLQAPQSEPVWGQAVGTDPYPVFGGAKVYDVSNCLGEQYSNVDSTRAYHDYRNGFCAVCGGFESATDMDGDGVYEIGNGGQLFWFAAQVNGGNTSACAILTADIDLENRAWTPIGTQEKPFNGQLNGQMHTVFRLSSTEDTGFRGLFGYVGGNGVVEKLGLLGEVSGGSYVGGIAGCNQGTIRQCFSGATVIGGTYVGGIAGANEGTILNCCNTGTVSGTDIVAGITGTNASGGAVSYCHNAAQGRIVAENKGSVRRCYYLFERDNRAGGKTADQFASGEVTFLLQEEQTEAVWGQTIGVDDRPTLGGAAVYQGGPCHVPQYHNDTFDITHIYDNGFCVHCDAYESAKYVGGVYQIFNAGQLFWFAAVVNGGYEKTSQNVSANGLLMAHIDLGDRSWTAIGNDTAYSGSFDGGFHEVRGQAVNLFGSMDGSVHNLHLQGFGSLAEVNNGIIAYCAVNGGQLAETHSGQILNSYTTYGTIAAVGEGLVVNSYYLHENGNGSGGKTAEQFASGEVAYLLRDRQADSVWGQTIGTEPYPVLGGAKVYAVGPCVGITGYSNTDSGGGHQYSDNGFCVYCDAYQPALDSNGDGVYEIGNAGQLYWFASVVNSGDVFADAVLCKDIRINQDMYKPMREWVPIGTPGQGYQGHFDGQGYGIEYLFASKTVEGVQGLFGAIGPEGLVERVALEALFNDGNRIGGIAAINQGIIRNCCSEVYAPAGDVIGGIAAVNEGQILHCFSAYHPTTGDNRGVAENCYYLSDAESADGGRTEAQIAGGEVAYLLQAPQRDRVWGQAIGTDSCPRLNGTRVYRGGLCDGQYSNSPVAVTHRFDNGFCTLCDAYEAAPDTNGDGYYEIGNGGQLYWFASLVNSGKTYANAVLTADIAVNPAVAAEQNDDLRAWLVIGSDELPYSGVFDGRGQSISGLYRYVTEYTFKDAENTVMNWNMTGLFGSVSKGGTVMNVTLKDSYFGGMFYIGGIAGTNYGKILNCAVDMYITTTGLYVGGIAGYNEGNITDCVNRSTVTGSSGMLTGGIVGAHGAGVILSCVNEGALTLANAGSHRTGGIAGESTALIRNCVNKGAVSGGWFTGGVVGFNDDRATLEKCANFGDVTGVYCAGGVCGDNEAVLRDCCNTGSVFSRDYGSGGVAGENNGKIDNCYNTGTVTSEACYVGGIVGTESESVIVDGKVSVITNCYYQSGCATDGGGTVQNGVGLYGVGNTKADIIGKTEAKTAQQFASGEVAYLLCGSTSDGTLAWGQDLDNGQPPQSCPVLDGAVVYFGNACTKKYSNTPAKQGHFFGENGFCAVCGAYEPAADKNGDGIYEIANGGQLFWYAAVVNSGYGDAAANSAASAILTADIDLENREWTPMGTQSKPFMGKFNGQFYVISRLRVDTFFGFQGLFGYVGSSGVVENVGLADASVSGGNYIGGIAGYNEGIIKKCFNGARVDGGGYIGGIAGGNEGDITNCYNTGIVSGSAYAGGIAGVNNAYSTIANCHNASAGGITAGNDGLVDSSYYLTDAENISGGKTEAQFISGEVAYLLGAPFGQNIDNGLPNPGYPVLNGAAVYPAGSGYRNTEGPAIIQTGRTLSYEDLIYVIDIFDLVGVENVDLSKDAGLLVWSVEEFGALSEIAFDEAHASVGLSPYKDTGYYYGASDGIFTRDLHKEAYYAGYVKLADGTYIYSEAKLYSPAIYAYAMLEKDTTSAETRTLCVALLNYISAAQGYFHGTAGDDLVNTGLNDEQKALNWTDISLNLAPAVPNDKQVERDTDVFTGTGKNLLFEEMISLTAIYKIDDGIVANARECGTIFWTAEQFAQLSGVPGVDNYGGGTKTGVARYRGNVGQWYSLAPKLAAKEMADTQYFYLGYVIHADGSVSYSGVMSYTVEQYIGNMVNGENTSAEMLAFAQRLYFYERAAKQALG